MNDNRPEEEERESLDEILGQTVSREQAEAMRSSLLRRIASSNWTSSITVLIFAQFVLNNERVIEYAKSLWVAVEANGTYILAIVGLLILFVGYIVWTGWFGYRLIQSIVQLYIEGRRFKQLAVTLAEFRQLLRARSSANGEHEQNALLEKIGSKLESIVRELSELRVPFPTEVGKEQSNIVDTWDVYLSLILPLATSGNLTDARGILRKMQGKDLDGPLIRLLRKVFRI